MRVIVAGASGFIGRRIVAALLDRGHAVTVAGRAPCRLAAAFPEAEVIDLVAGVPSLRGYDVAINAVGVAGANAAEANRDFALTFARQAVAGGVTRLVVLSALGASSDAPADFLRQRAASDEAALRLGKEHRTAVAIVRPSVVVGREGASSRMFASLAAVGMALDVAGAELQPVHVHDLAHGIAALATNPDMPVGVLEAGGPDVMGTVALIHAFAVWLGRNPPVRLPVPKAAFPVAGLVGELFGGVPLSRELAACLALPNRVTGRSLWEAVRLSPTPIATALVRHSPAGPSDRTAARLLVPRWALLAAMAALWIGTGLISAMVSTALGYELLAEMGLHGPFATLLLYGGAAADLVLGIALLAVHGRRRRTVLWTQLAVVVGYTALVTLFAPAHWLHPFGPILKNLPVLAGTAALIALEDD
ncbi:SDR family oxidoreductase [Azospirillum soli]|uniref:SDR family oxidoreductase n=1 Tax=Azospirillum soli TaxID=1304799 RepID=UPI001AE622A1|nr:SDR family oxidoreductase [Azospirillum soli]MBP2314446.1 uncharacterized protein YbjT (DUF2867 family) [Azospirillum soli]